MFLQPIDGLDQYFKTYPSNKIFYSKYPYAVRCSFDLNPNMKLWKAAEQFKADLDMFAGDSLTYNMRAIINHQHKHRVYFQTLDDLVKFLDVYGKYVGYIEGPISDDHIELLKSVKSFEVRNPYYNKWDTKVKIYPPPGSWFKRRYPGSHNIEDENTHQSVMEFLRDLTDKKILNEEALRYYPHDHYGIECFCQWSEFSEILAFMRLMHPKIRIRTTRTFREEDLRRK